MTVSCYLTVNRHFDEVEVSAEAKYEITKVHLGSVLGYIEAKYGEDALLKLLDAHNIPPVYSSAV